MRSQLKDKPLTYVLKDKTALLKSLIECNNYSFIKLFISKIKYLLCIILWKRLKI